MNAEPPRGADDTEGNQRCVSSPTGNAEGSGAPGLS